MAKATKLQDVMTRDPITLSTTARIAEAARVMRDSDIGVVLINDDNEQFAGLLTDRDIVTRAIAKGEDPEQIEIGRILSKPEHQLGPEASIDAAVEMMSKAKIRRIPVVEGNRCVGIVSLGDLATERDPRSALGRISAAPPNR